MSIKIEQTHPFYRPLWRRWLIVVLTTVWAALEWIVARDPFWGLLATALAGYAAWVLIYNFPAGDDPQKDAGKTE
jgi:hypothetical protein